MRQLEIKTFWDESRGRSDGLEGFARILIEEIEDCVENSTVSEACSILEFLLSIAPIVSSKSGLGSFSTGKARQSGSGRLHNHKGEETGERLRLKSWALDNRWGAPFQEWSPSFQQKLATRCPVDSGPAWRRREVLFGVLVYRMRSSADTRIFG